MRDLSPAYRAYTVREGRDETKKSWVAIGAAWIHRDEKGIDIVLDALPVDGNIVLRVYEPRSKEDGSANPQPAKKAPRANDSRSGQRWKRN
jgi:hypothetical protein